MEYKVGDKPKCWYIDSITEETRFSAGWKPSLISVTLSIFPAKIK